MFKLSKYLGGRGAYPDIVELPANDSVTYEAGLAITVASGKAAIASGTTVPTYVCAGPAKNGVVPCWKIDSNAIFEVAAAGTHVVGTAYTIGTDGASVTTTSTSGVAKCVRANDERNNILVTFA